MPDKTITPNIYQRLIEVAKQTGLIEATGKNQFRNEAVSIEDVENEIRPLLAEHGIITRWSYDEDLDVKIIEEKTSKGTQTLYMVTLHVTVVNVDDGDTFVDHWTDVGGNPAAAASFARKGYYKALFHIAAGDDEQVSRRSSRRDEPESKEDPNGPVTSKQLKEIRDLYEALGQKESISKSLTHATAETLIEQLDNDLADHKTKMGDLKRQIGKLLPAYAEANDMEQDDAADEIKRVADIKTPLSQATLPQLEAVVEYLMTKTSQAS